ncbi:MAG: ATP-binding cassette domain-containing protein [Anaerolineae bacterium]
MPDRPLPMDAARATDPLISLQQVVLQHDGQPLSDPIDWTIHQGEQWAILGPTGAGKSVLARTLAGISPPLDGLVHDHLSGEACPATDGENSSRSGQGSVAYVGFEHTPRGGEGLFHQARWHASLEITSPAVNDYLSAEAIWRRNPHEVVPHPTESPSSFRARQKRVAEWLELSNLFDRRLHQLSDGEWRRVQIARALLRDPQLLILDDPFVGLDPQFRTRLGELLSRLIERGIHLVIVSSDPQAIPTGITHVLLLERIPRSRVAVAAQGPRDEVLGTCPTTTPPQLLKKSHDRLADPKVTAPTSPVIQMRNVTVVQNGVALLQGVHWIVRQGEKWALIGPNGAGKTTLLSLILGDHPQAYANDIALFGQPRGSGESIWEIKRRMGWVSPELHRYHPPEISLISVVCSGFFDSLGLHRRSSPEQQAQAKTWLQRLGVAEEAERPFQAVAKGTQRLALIARALIKEPELVVLDEPCQGLDAVGRERVLAALENIAQAPTRTLIYVTHRRRELFPGLTHVLQLSRGRVTLASPLEDIDTLSSPLPGSS